MSQNTFDFISSSAPVIDLQDEITRHNRVMAAAAQTPLVPSGSLLGALDAGATRLNGVYMLRGILARQVQAALETSNNGRARRNFLKSLKGEINIKKSGQDAAVTVRNILVQTRL